MTNSDVSAGATGGPATPPGLDDLPEKLRVHALAKLLGRTSREVLAALADLGVTARSAQSSVDRKAAEQVVSALRPELQPEPDGPPEDVPVADTVAPDLPAPVFGRPAPVADPVPVLAPLFAPPAPVFAPPVPVFDTPAPAASPPARRTRRHGAAADRPDPAEVALPPAAPVEADDELLDEPVDDSAEPIGEIGDDESEESAARRRRRRGRRGRGRGRGGDDIGESTDDAETGDAGDAESVAEPVAETAGGESDEDAEDATDDDTDEGGSRRRRRRRRRRGSGDEAATDDETDPPNTVVRVRAPRERPDDTDGDGVQSVRGSTRLEAKRQRRRDGRDAGRRRVPILSEAEFLARRESVERSMVVRESGDRIEVGVLEDGVLVEHFITGGIGQNGGSLVGNIYLGRVQNVLPSMEAAFVDIGRGRNAVLYAGEVDWDAAGLGGRARRIEQALSSGDSVLVQVTKDPVGHKGARLTTQISLAGRFLVYVPSGGAAGISRKLPDVERKRLKDMLREIVPSEAGVIIRTASEGVSQEALERDVRRLQAQWAVVKEKAEKTGPQKPKAPVLLYEEPDMLVKVVRDQFNEDFSRLIVSGDDAWETVSHYVGHVASELAGRLHRHVGSRDVFEEYRIDEQLLKALDRKVWLPSGGTLVIDRTEAMTVVDVNTGKYTGSGGNLEETVTRNNLEAAEEIVRQLRLRDIGGIIVIDFIDMVLEANRDLVLRRLTECLARDRTRHQVAEVTSLGLVQMTRKRVGGGLLEHFSTPCEHCRGRGVIISTELAAAEPAERERNGDRTGERNGDSGGGRRSRGRGRRDEQGGDRRRLPDAILPDRAEAAMDVGAPVPAAPAEAVHVGAVEPVTMESVRDDVEEVVVEQSLAAGRNRHAADGQPADGQPAVGQPADASAGNGSAAAAPVPDVVSPAVPASAVSVSAVPAPDAAAPDAAAPGVAVPGVAPRDVADRAGRNGTPAPGTAPTGSESAGAARSNGAAPEPDVEPVQPSRPARRRGRVTRSGGAPTAGSGDAPVVAVVTVPAARPVAAEPAPEAVSPAPAEPAAEPAPAAPARARRVRRTASRPAGPPVGEAGNGDAGGQGDPV